jgi:YD repeat-containing protein
MTDALGSTSYKYDARGRLWEIKSAKGSNVRQDVKHTWDASGNLLSRQDVLTSETESFSYDLLDRLTSASGNYS